MFSVHREYAVQIGETSSGCYETLARIGKVREIQFRSRFLPLMSFARTRSSLIQYSTHSRPLSHSVVTPRVLPRCFSSLPNSHLSTPRPRQRLAAKHSPWPTPPNMSWSNVLQSYARMKDPEKELPKGVLLNCNKETYVLSAYSGDG